MVDKAEIERRLEKALDAKAREERVKFEENAKRISIEESEHAEFLKLIDSVVAPAFQAVSEAVRKKGYSASIAERSLRDEIAYANYSTISLEIGPSEKNPYEFERSNLTIMKDKGSRRIKITSSLGKNSGLRERDNDTLVSFDIASEQVIMKHVMDFMTNAL